MREWLPAEMEVVKPTWLTVVAAAVRKKFQAEQTTV
jgi:hypothetical protein